MALAFTVASFWWLHARPGTLRTYEPTTWASIVDRDRSGLRLPLVLHNTGASACVVLGLRLRFTDSGNMMLWEWTLATVNPTENDVKDVTAPFSIAGGATHELVAEFVGEYPGTVPQQRAYPVTIDARTSRMEEWHPVLGFDLQLGNLVHPSNYIVYTNDPDYLTKEERAAGGDRLDRLRKQYGLDPAAETAN